MWQLSERWTEWPRRATRSVCPSSAETCRSITRARAKTSTRHRDRAARGHRRARGRSSGWNWRAGDEVVLVGARHAYGDANFPLGGCDGRRAAVVGEAPWAVANQKRSLRRSALSPTKSPPSVRDERATSRRYTTSRVADSRRPWPRWSRSPVSAPCSTNSKRQASSSASFPAACHGDQ